MKKAKSLIRFSLFRYLYKEVRRRHIPVVPAIYSTNAVFPHPTGPKTILHEMIHVSMMKKQW